MRIANGTLILVADGAKTLLFRNDGDEKYPVLTTLAQRSIENPASAEQGTDQPGRVFASLGEKRSSYGETDWHQQAEDRFAVEAVELLRQTCAHEPGGVVVIAPPRTLGVLRREYGDAVEKRLRGEIAKDLAGHTTDDIVDALTAHHIA